MKKKWWIIAIATLAGCIGLAFVIPALRPSRASLTKENFDRIEIGMSRAEVEAILGPPAAAWLGAPIWESDLADEAIIRFDKENRVKAKHWDEWPDDRTLLEKVMDQLPWRERPVRQRPRPIY
jgi:hypothetical protein